MKQLTLPSLIALAVLVCGGCFSLLFLQYPIQRHFVQKHHDRIQSIESTLTVDRTSTEDLEKLLDYVNSSPGPVQYSAIRSLGRIDADNFDEVERLAELLSHKDHGTRRAAILAIKDQGDAAISIIPEITKCLSDPKALDVRVFAAQALGNLGADAEPALEDLQSARSVPSNKAFISTFDRAIENIESAITESESDRE